MVEKKQVLYDLTTAYKGPFLVEDFYAEIDAWINENGFEKEPKRKSEHVEKDGKRIELSIEAYRKLDDLHYGVIVLRAQLNNIKDTAIKRDGKKIRINHGEVFISVDAFIQSYVHSGFLQAKPVYTFIRALIDKYVYSFWTDKHDGTVNSAGKDLFRRIRQFFEMQGRKYGLDF